MAWLFACFGYSKTRKRLKSSHKIRSQDKGTGSYQPLKPSLRLAEDSEEPNPKPIRSNLKRRIQDKSRNRKKVRFNLNVIAYEPVQSHDDDNDDVNEDDLRSILAAEWEEQEDQETDEDNEDFNICKGNSTGVKRERSCTFAYRYSNCYDDEEELGLEIDDNLDEEEEEDDDEDQERKDLEASQDTLESDLFRSRCVTPVLIPIENINQLRAIKKKRCEITA